MLSHLKNTMITCSGALPLILAPKKICVAGVEKRMRRLLSNASREYADAKMYPATHPCQMQFQIEYWPKYRFILNCLLKLIVDLYREMHWGFAQEKNRISDENFIEKNKEYIILIGYQSGWDKYKILIQTNIWIYLYQKQYEQISKYFGIKNDTNEYPKIFV